MPNNLIKRLSGSRVVRIFVAYDQPEAGDRAEELCAQLEKADEFPFEVQPWRANPAAIEESQVRLAATQSDVVVIAWAAPEGPPAYLLQSVAQWLAQRSVTNATLAALPVGLAVKAPHVAAILHRLRQLASGQGMTFVCDWTEGIAPRQGERAELQQREQLVTPTLLGILAERHLEPHLQWGLNE